MVESVFRAGSSRRPIQSIVTPTSMVAHAALRGLFRRLNERNITYVVPRKYEFLPAGTVGDDVDLYIAPEDFTAAIEIGERTGFVADNSVSGPTDRLQRLAGHAIRNPETAARELVSSPRKVVRLLRGRQLSSDDQSNTARHSRGEPDGTRTNVDRSGNRRSGEHTVQHLYCEGTKLDLSNHVAYRTMPGRGGPEVPADPIIEQHLFETRQRYNGFFVPAPADELAHVVSHCVFDYDGWFSAYYRDRCEALVEQVTASDEALAEFDRLLKAVFDANSETVSSLVIKGEYDSIPSA